MREQNKQQYDDCKARIAKNKKEIEKDITILQ
jgi:hypothetical protein